MGLYRVVISYLYNQQHYHQERGVKAMSPGQATDDALRALNVTSSNVSELRTFTEFVKNGDARRFALDSLLLPCINTDASVAEVLEEGSGR